jgi:glycosyltransferase involved in cell wall biosynthesis
MPTISIIIPAYNAERTILKTIKSVQQQTFQDFELIVINDDSKDQTLELLQTVKDERLKIFSYENGGLPVARNRGIDLATGEFISFIDADDLWTVDKLELQLAALRQNPKAGVAYSWTACFIDGREESIFPYKPVFFEGNVYEKLLVNNIVSNGSNILVRKQVIESVGKFEPTLKSCEDWDFYIRLAAKWHFVVVPKHQILYRQSSNAMTSKVEIMEQEALRVIERAYQSAPPKYQFLKNQSLAWIYEYCTQQYLKYSTDISGVKKASQKLWAAICLHPPILFGDYAPNLIKWLIKKWILILLAQGQVAKSKILLLTTKG